jgi:hypothetical protein
MAVAADLPEEVELGEVTPAKAERPVSRSGRCGTSSSVASHPVSGWVFVKAASASALTPKRHRQRCR